MLTIHEMYSNIMTRSFAGIYKTWAECEMQIKGYSGARYKSFESMMAAEKYMVDGNELLEEQINSEGNLIAQINNQVNEELRGLEKTEVVAFVDGSYSSSEDKSGFGVIIIDSEGMQTPLYKAFTKQLNEDFLELKNVAAELEGVKEAVKWAIAYKKTRIKIYYDYEGIGKWANGSWKAKKGIKHMMMDLYILWDFRGMLGRK